jgi:hypothetical protein
MSTLAANECRRQLRYNYLDAERIEKVKGLAEALNRFSSTEAELARVKKDYASRMDTIQAEIDLLNGCVLSGYELREYLCFWEYDQPRAGRKTLRKREGGEIVGEEDMTERDRQMIIDIIDNQAATAGTKTVLAITDAQTLPVDPIDVTLDDEQRSSFEFTDDECDTFASWFRDMFVGISGALLADADREENLSAFFRNETEKDVERFGRWLHEEPRPEIPGAAWLAGAVEAHLKGIEIQRQATKTREAAEKKAAKKGRKAGASGTVEVPADEGSRDDAGADSKNNL